MFTKEEIEIEKYVTATDANVKIRQRIEIRIAAALVTAAIAAGYSIRVDNGGDWDELEPMRDTVISVLADMFASDDDRLYLYKNKTDEKAFGWVWFVYGNDGWDVISDYTINVEPLMDGEVAKLQEFYG